MVNETLAKKMAGDGEGATALFEVKVVGAESIKQARTLQNQLYAPILQRLQLPDMITNWENSLCNGIFRCTV